MKRRLVLLLAASAGPLLRGPAYGYLEGQLGAGSVGPSQLAASAVQTSKLKTDAVDSTKILYTTASLQGFGIGTRIPASNLDVNGNAQFENGSVTLGGSSATLAGSFNPGGILLFQTASDATRPNLQFINANTGLGAQALNKLDFWSAGSVQMHLEPASSGGFGSNVPLTVLSSTTILGTGGSTGILAIKSLASSNPTDNLNFLNNAGTVIWQIGANSAVSGSALEFNNGDGAANRMLLTTAGNLGIGTTSPATKLHMSSGTLTVDGNTAYTINTGSSAQYGSMTVFNASGTVQTSGGIDAALLMAGGTSKPGYVSFSGNAAAATGLVGVEGSAGSLIAGSSIGDIVIRSATKNIVFSANTGSSMGMVILAGNAQHIEYGGAAPTLGACGTTPSIVGNDNAHTVTVGGGVTSCVVNFNTSWTNNPICNCSDRTTLGDCKVSSIGIGSITWGNVVAGDVLDIRCTGYR